MLRSGYRTSKPDADVIFFIATEAHATTRKNIHKQLYPSAFFRVLPWQKYLSLSDRKNTAFLSS